MNGTTAQVLGIALLAASVCNVQAQNQTSLTRTYYAGTGLLQSETRDGVTTSFTYTPTGDLKTVTNASGFVSTYSNYKRGIAGTEVHATGKPEQVTLAREIDDLGCITSETDGELNKTVFGRDVFCRVTSVTPALSGSTASSIVYAPYAATSPETDTLTRGNYVEITKFDGFGHRSETTAGGVKRTWGYDAFGRNTFEAYPVDAAITSPTGTSFGYDAFDRLIQITHSDASFSTFQFLIAADGSPQTRITDERGNFTYQTFRAMSGPESSELMIINTPVAAADVSLSRNVIGQVTQVLQAGFTRTYNYDANYHLASVVNPETGTTLYGRDLLGNLTSVRVGSSGTTYFDINGLNEV